MNSDASGIKLKSDSSKALRKENAAFSEHHMMDVLYESFMSLKQALEKTF